MTSLRLFGRTVIATIMAVVAMTAAPAQTQTTNNSIEHRYPHLSFPRWQYYQQHPDEFQQLLQSQPPVSHELVPGTLLAPGQMPAGGTWTSLNNPAGVNLMNPILLTDGTVIAHVSCTRQWYKFTPDINGSYINGTWTQIASLPSGYAPRFVGSGVLPDGRVVVEGGEYNNTGSGCNSVWTNKGAIYDPIQNTWTSINPPSGWAQIGDAAGIVLPNGSYMQTDCCDSPPKAALLDSTTLTWVPTGTSKFDVYDEESMALLPDDTVLTVDAYVFTGTCGQGSERYDASTGAWSSAGNVGNQQSDCNSSFPSYEVGPLVMRPNGTAVSFSGLTTGTASTAIYDATAHTWTGGPAIPSVGGAPYTLADAPAVVLPNGNILFAASPGNWTKSEQFPKPTHYFEMSIADNSISAAADKSDAASFGAWEENFLVLPTGQIMAFTIDGPTVQIYTPSGSPNASWAPTITSVPTTIDRATSYTLTGTQLNGLSEGAYYGDDTNASTNFPIVQITNNGTGHVFYARTLSHSSRSIALGASSSTHFVVPASVESGASALVVIANGIASAPTAVTITNAPVLVVSPRTNPVASGPQGGPFSPASFSYTLTASNDSVNYSITGAPSWLDVSSSSGTVTTSPTTISFTVNAGANSLAAGTYGPTTITFSNTSNGLGNTTRAATLTVLPTMIVTPATAVSSLGNQGGPFAPASVDYQLSASSGSLNYSITGVPSWLDVSSTSGSLTASPTTVTFSVNASANSLVIGTYSATISFTNTTNNQGNQTRAASLSVNFNAIGSPRQAGLRRHRY